MPGFSSFSLEFCICGSHCRGAGCGICWFFYLTGDAVEYNANQHVDDGKGGGR